MNVEDVLRLFGPPVVRVLLDWERLRTASPHITVSQGVAGRILYAPWYVSDGREVDHRDPMGEPIELSDRQALAGLGRRRRERIDGFATSAACDENAVVAVPLYDLGNSRFLVLDGNHRLAAMTLHRLRMRLLVVTIHGPLDPSILPDLARYLPRNRAQPRA